MVQSPATYDSGQLRWLISEIFFFKFYDTIIRTNIYHIFAIINLTRYLAVFLKILPLNYIASLIQVMYQTDDNDDDKQCPEPVYFLVILRRFHNKHPFLYCYNKYQKILSVSSPVCNPAFRIKDPDMAPTFTIKVIFPGGAVRSRGLDSVAGEGGRGPGADAVSLRSRRHVSFWPPFSSFSPLL
jgi:hypothetical protein